MTTGKRIKKRRTELGLTVDDLAKKLGKNRATVYRYESDEIENFPTSVLEPLAKALKTSPAYLMGWVDAAEDSACSFSNLQKLSTVINVYGRVAAGIPLEMIEDVIDTEEIPEDMAKTGSFFGLQIHGDSMEPKISDGDIVIVRQQDDAESGDTVIATVNGTDATCKRLRKYRDGIELISTNPSYEPMFFSNQEIKTKPVRIIGRVVELRAKF